LRIGPPSVDWIDPISGVLAARLPTDYGEMKLRGPRAEPNVVYRQDRLLYLATVVDIKGKSYRMRRHQAQLEGERGGHL